MAKKNNDKMQERYFDYLLTYVNTIFEFSDELQKLSKKKLSWEVSLNRKKYTYFSINNWVTILNRKNDLEMSFVFSTDKENVLFQKNKFHNFIESDLNANGLWKDFPSNKITRAEEFEECFNKIMMSGIIKEVENGYLIKSDELY